MDDGRRNLAYKGSVTGNDGQNCFESGNDMTLASNPIETYEVPEGRKPQRFEEELTEIVCRSQTDDRDRFINGLSEWLSNHTTWT